MMSEDERPRAGIRSFRDSDGGDWVVYELSRASGGELGVRPCLVFECPAAIRRVRSYPADWYLMSDPDLERLSWRR
jgi:hypothetical protein